MIVCVRFRTARLYCQFQLEIVELRPPVSKIERTEAPNAKGIPIKLCLTVIIALVLLAFSLKLRKIRLKPSRRPDLETT
ncbi:hypothetical protein SDJN02_20968 [Cucurbita argyrosperma subsp. argyrosperma]|nr:hypothetical protein SDJN02_20968 [Cucurbita argyrosperma subsp. argyrosperma]